MGGTIYADSSAALAIAKRKGAGKLRHIHINSPWVQERQAVGDIAFAKILGTENPADLVTKLLVKDKIDKCMAKIGQVRREGRADCSLELQGS